MRQIAWKFLGSVVLATLLVISYVQLNTPAVHADGCPDNPFSNCSCTLIDAQSVEYGGQIHWYCTYDCYCTGPGGGDPFYIERTYDFWQ